MPRFTVIAPMYDVEDYVSECIDSLKAQEFGDFEAIFVDDGSQDGSYGRAVEAAGADPRFKMMRLERNSGLSVARNEALERASGEYVLFLDSDDAYAPETLRLLDEACAQDLDAVFFNARMLYDSNDLVRTNFESYAERRGPQGVVSGYTMLVEMGKLGSFRSSACMYAVRRSLLDSNGLRFYPGIIHEDQLFTLQLFAYLGRCAFLPEALYIRRMRHGSTMTVKRGMRNVDGLFTVSRELERHLYAHAVEWPADFLDAFCHELHVTWEILAHDARDVGPDALREYRGKLDPADRAAFDLHVVEAGACLKATEGAFEDSTTFKVGKAIMALPIWVKERLRRAPE